MSTPTASPNHQRSQSEPIDVRSSPAIQSIATPFVALTSVLTPAPSPTSRSTSRTRPSSTYEAPTPSAHSAYWGRVRRPASGTVDCGESREQLLQELAFQEDTVGACGCRSLANRRRRITRQRDQ